MRVPRRQFLRASIGTLPLLSACGRSDSVIAPSTPAPVPPEGSAIFHVQGIPDAPFTGSPNRHAGVDALVSLMAQNGLMLHRSSHIGETSGPDGLIAAGDVVLVKVNAQWKYRGCTNSDVVRGLIQSILEHPDGFAGEIVIVENGQGRGSLNCDTAASYGDWDVHANANDERHSFLYLVEDVFRGKPVSAYLLDPIRAILIGDDDHVSDGYRYFGTVSYPCFTTAQGTRVELREGIWNGTNYERKLKLINVPVLKHHDVGGSEITGAVKHFYGLLSMSDGHSGERHYARLGEACGQMIASVRPPVLSIVDAIWVSHGALRGYPASATHRANQLVASQDPVAADFWAALHVLFPIDGNERHSPMHPGIERWLTACMDYVNAEGGIVRPDEGIRLPVLTKTESEMPLFSTSVG